MAMQQITSNFVYFGLRQVLGETAEQVVQSIGDYFTDPSRKLPRALERANEKAWKTLELALLGSTWTGKLKNWIVKGDIRAIRLPIESVITQKERENRNFRKHCIQELQSVRDNGLDPILSTDLDELKERTLSFKCFTDASALLEDSWKVMENVSQSLAETGCPSLAELIGYRTADGSPLLVVAFGFFLREEIVSDPILRDELLFDQMKQIWKPQAPSFVEIEKTMKELGEQFERSVTEARDTLLHALGEIYEQGERTFSAVLDIDESLRELNADQQETRRCLKEIRGLLSHMKAQSGEIKPRLSFSLRNDYEKIQVKELLNQSRCLPPDQQRCPALQNGLAKLQVAVGEFDEAEKRFCELENQVDHPSVKAELLFNAYQTALENKKWKEALSYLTQSAQLDPTHFARFPMEKYPAEKILGAGGFGVVFLCQHQYLRRKVAIKTYYCDDLARKFENIFNEAQILSQLNYPSLIQVHDCGYADSEKKYPFMVMEYFPGEDLEEYIQKRGTLSIDETVSLAREIAKTIQIAHKEGILHRDLKPENILVHKNNNNGNNGDDWKLKIIDFGLALNISVLEKEYALRSRGKSMLGSSVSGTYLYAPPEQRGELSAPIQPYSDIYAFGKTLCYLLFQTTDITLTHWRKIGDHPLAELINGCIHKNPQDRFQSFDAVLESLKHKTSSSESSRLQEVAKPQGKEPPKLRRTDVCALDSPKPQ